jgi:hypothetical protein
MADQKPVNPPSPEFRPPSLNEKQKKELAEVLGKRGVRPDCPMCGKQQWTLLDAYLNHHLQTELTSAFVIGGPSLPAAAIVCGNCGFVSQHALGALGMLGKARGD